MIFEDAWRLIVRTILLLVAVGLALTFLWEIRDILALVLAASIVAAGVGPVAYRIHEFEIGPRRWRIPPVFGVLIVYIGLTVLLVTIGSIVFPPIFTNLIELINAAPTIFKNVEHVLDQQRVTYPFIPEIKIDQGLIVQGATQLRAFLPNAFSIFFGFVNSIVQMMFILVLALYLTIEAPHLRDFVLRLIPVDQRTHFLEVTTEIAWRTGRWVIGQLILATVVGAAVGIVMFILGVPYPFALAFVAFIGELIPTVGPIVTGVAMALVALTTSPLQFTLTVAWAILVQQLENNLLVPRIVGTAVGISPLTVILALLIGGSLLGIVGAILAVPVAAALQVLITRLIEIKEEQTEQKEIVENPGAVGEPDDVPSAAGGPTV